MDLHSRVHIREQGRVALRVARLLGIRREDVYGMPQLGQFARELQPALCTGAPGRRPVVADDEEAEWGCSHAR